MYRLFFPFFLLTLIFSCNGPKNLGDPISSVEIRELDTLYVEATPLSGDWAGEKEVVRVAADREVDLLHTRLDLRFNWEEESVLGKASLVLKPYFYSIDTLTLDAKNFEWNLVSTAPGGQPLPYRYDGTQIHIALGKTFTRTDSIRVYLDYVARPSETGGSAAINSNRGLFFVNATSTDPGLPRQIWTQGETEHNSNWFPTVDKPNERCTQEMFITVDSSLKTLSNGVLVQSTSQADGTRTDYWRMDLPHAPYLFMLAIGDFALVEDQWRGKLLQYYVEPEFEADARAIFPHTPEMLGFFSDKLGVEYPWAKFSQVVVRDFVSGAMENTTAVIYGDFIQAHQADLAGDLTNDQIVAHEMFHHWFGDLVTCESWANLTLNEGFANYSEYLWLEHKYGPDEAEFHRMNELNTYLGATSSELHPLIHYGYAEKEDMFDRHSYNKGGLVLHLLRRQLGEEAFFATLNRYLTEHAFTEVEADELRIAFEETTGLDMKKFFDQWYYSQGHPILMVEAGYDDLREEVVLSVRQMQDPEQMPAVFEFPVMVEWFAQDGSKQQMQLQISERNQEFRLPAPGGPASLVLFDSEHWIPAEVSFAKSVDELVFQFRHAKNVVDRYEALSNLISQNIDPNHPIWKEALEDSYWQIRSMGLNTLFEAEDFPREKVVSLAKTDPHPAVRSAAVELWMTRPQTGDMEEMKQIALSDPAATVQVSAIFNLYFGADSKPLALELCSQLEQARSAQVRDAVSAIYLEERDTKYLPYFKTLCETETGFDQLYALQNYSSLAMNGDIKTVEEAAAYLFENSTKPPIGRLGAMAGLFDLHNHVMEMSKEEKDDRESWEALDAKLLEWLKTIRDAETDPDLIEIFKQFPIERT